MNDYLTEKYGDQEYILVRESECNAELFLGDINFLMDFHYEPVGGVAVRVGSSGGADLLQAMRRVPVDICEQQG